MRGVVWNDNTENYRGWKITYRIPFASLGYTAPPPHGTIWGLAVAVYDRDDAAGSPITTKRWPNGLEADRPVTWGQIHFGLPAFTPPSSSSQYKFQVR